MSKLNTNPADVIEPFGVADVFCEGVVRTQQLGPCTRLTFAVSDMVYGNGAASSVVAKLVIPTAAIPDLILALQGRSEDLNDRLVAFGCPAVAN
ncbi:hypothetical protein [Tardiphaga sp. vice278]|uniref:hypothetical protein n=1 Tax=Tardiphaga sp. vice278 TaxID=2592815 RepID=UPI0011623113|nr:hypothetical protein [Tardiphaga sp. vice278]QDM15167.1 hypothetical protein FNL53_03710 [Tardiphaga sp. vice278]